jgi:creatinine amidohydrolase/Fe(II)-dependent formamide hydrolase-like protein
MSRKLEKKKKHKNEGEPGSSAIKVDYNTHPTVIDPMQKQYYMPLMTWIEIRDCIKHGRDSVLIVVGGYDNNGPYTVLDKHQLILKPLLNELAKKVPILIAPIMSFAPLRDSSSNHSPGTFELPIPIFISVIIETLRACQEQGFKKIIVSTDHGGNNPVTPGCLEEAVRQFNAMHRYRSKACYFPEFYNLKKVRDYVRNDLGYKEYNEGIHDEIVFTSQLMALNPDYVRYYQRKKSNKLRINGIDISSLKEIKKLGRDIFKYRISLLIKDIRQYIES